MSASDQEHVLLLEPEELLFFLETGSAGEMKKEELVKGYKVKVNYQAVKETKKKTKQEAVTQVSFRR